ncbi:MAG: hypothetical protein IT374_05735 [Polyangiaceae bacterium]|nr:hypothetical protein [Polyangiaceae bacterium]
MKNYPIVFSCRDTIVGNGFVAQVSIDGRAVLTHEDGGDLWMFGVQPGSVAGGIGAVQHVNGAACAAAFAQFKEHHTMSLFDIASDAESFDVFKSEVEKYFAQVHEANARDWAEALEAVRRSQTAIDDVVTLSADSRKPSLRVDVIWAAGRASTVEIEASLNVQPRFEQAA